MDKKLKLIILSGLCMMMITGFLFMNKVLRHLYHKNIYNKTIKNIMERLEEAKTMIDEAALLLHHAVKPYKLKKE